MNAKQLTDAAKRVLKNIPTADTRLLADHILATVRPDDDEPVTRERLEADSCGAKKRKTPLGTVYYSFGTVLAYNPDKAELFLNGGSVGIKLKSMGHLRRLVAALGE
jgi:hypothetical protein